LRRLVFAAGCVLLGLVFAAGRILLGFVFAGVFFSAGSLFPAGLFFLAGILFLAGAFGFEIFILVMLARRGVSDHGLGGGAGFHVDLSVVLLFFIFGCGLGRG
jgi:hypothetical protein